MGNWVLGVVQRLLLGATFPPGGDGKHLHLLGWGILEGIWDGMDGWDIIAVILDFGIQNADLDNKRGVDGVLVFFCGWITMDG